MSFIDHTTFKYILVDVFQKMLDLNNMKVDAVKPTEYKSFKAAKKAHKLV